MQKCPRFGSGGEPFCSQWGGITIPFEMNELDRAPVGAYAKNAFSKSVGFLAD